MSIMFLFLSFAGFTKNGMYKERYCLNILKRTRVTFTNNNNNE